MARILGIEIPNEKRIEASLPYMFGIGRPTAAKILEHAGIDPNIRTGQLTEDQLVRISQVIQTEGVLVEGDLRRELGFKGVLPVLRKSVISSAVIMFIIACAAVFSWLLNRQGVPDIAAEWIATSFDSSGLYLLVVNLFLFVVGMFVETSASIIVLAPILAEAAEKLGIDQVHFGTIMVVNLALGMITPPFGVNLFAACTVAKISLDRIVKDLIPFIGVILGCLMLISYVPEISLTLRDWIYNK